MAKLLWSLIVEDSEHDTHLLLRELKKGGYEVEWERVETRSAMEAALARQPWDIIICDNSLPQFSAMEAITVLKKSGLDIPLIIISGTIDEEGAVTALKAGAHDFLVKGKLARLIPAIERELQDAEVRRERKLALEALRESEEHFRVALKDLPIVVFNQDRELRYIWIASPHPGFSNEAILGKTDADLLPPEEARRLTELKRQVLTTGVGVRSEVMTTIAGMAYFYDLIVEPLRDSNGNIVGITCASLDITERKTAEARLQASESRYRLATRATNDVIWEWNPQTNQLLWTENAQRVFGYSPEEIGPEEKWWDEHIHPDDRERVVSKLNALIAGNESIWLEEYRFLLKDGSYAYVSDHGYIERDAVGTPLRMIGAMSDITERKRAEQALRESEEKFENIIRHSSSMFYTHTADHVLTYVSPQSHEILDCEPEEAMVRWQEFLSDHPSNRQGVEATQRAIETGQREPPYQLELITHKGRKIWVQVDESPVVRDGQTIAIVGSITDFTERKRLEEKLRRNEEVLRIFVEHSPAAIAMFDRDMRYIAASRHYLTDYGLGEQNLIGRSHYEVFPEIPERWKEIHRRCLAGAVERAEEDPFPRADGRLDWVRWELHPWYEASGEIGGIILFSEVITERKRAELRIQHLTRLYATLSQVNQMIVRVKERIELFQTICKVSVDYGKFGLAWIGLLDRETGQVTPVAVHGVAQGQLPFQTINVKQAPFKNRLTGSAVEAGRVVYSQDIQADPNMQHWRELAVAGDFHSAAAIPFRLNGEIFGLLNLYATEVDFFADKEQHNLLEEMGLDISFALDTIELETRREQAEESLRSSEDRYRDLVNNSQDLICTHDLEGRILSVNPYAEQVLGYPTGRLLQMNLRDILTPDAQKYFGEYLSNIRKHGIAEGTMLVQTTKGETRIWQYRNTLRTEGVAVPIVRGMARDITEQRQAQEAVEQSEKNYRAIVENTLVGVYRTTLRGDILYVNEALARILEFETPAEVIAQGVIARYADPKDREILLNMLREEGRVSAMDLNLLTRQGKVKSVLLSATLEGEILTGMITDVTARKQAEEAFRQTSRLLQSIVSAAPLAIITYDPDGFVLTWNAAATRMFGWDEQEVIGQLPPYVPREAFAEFQALRAQTIQGKSLTGIEVRRQRKDGAVVDINLNTAPLYDHTGQISGYVAMIEDITERKRAQETLREKERLLSEAQRIGHIGSWSYDIVNNSLEYSDEMYRLFDVSPQEFQHTSEALLELIYPSDRRMVAKWMEDIRAGRQASELEFLIFRKNSELRYIRCRGAVEFDVTGQPARFIGTAQDVTERKLAEIQIRQQIERLTALREVDQAISSSFDLNVTLDVLLAHLVSQLHVDAADVLLLEPDGQTLSCAAAKGFLTTAVESTPLRLADSQAVRERRLIHVENLENKPDIRLVTPLGASEGFVCYFGLPLIVKGKTKGLLEIFHRASLHPYAEWLDFLNTLAGQAAIAIENSQLFENLEHSNRELTQAYDATIEGWSRALDLRDKETEGHTQRVTRMTLELAARMGVSEAERVHIRRGALLHDMGKLGVPDYILLKPGALDEEEWALMRQHPQYAYDMLKPIRFLHPALDIPYSHHEKWDGSGYPRGLKGEQIPLAARIFAVVDVWDALSSDRPYRPAWPREKVREHIRSQAGVHFDPNVVEAFLELNM